MFNVAMYQEGITSLKSVNMANDLISTDHQFLIDHITGRNYLGGFIE